MINLIIKRKIRKILEFIKKQWKFFAVFVVILGVILAIILLGLYRHLDSNQFLTDLFSGLLILLLGWGIAWTIVHKYQKRNIEMQNKNMLIEDIDRFRVMLIETKQAWLRWGEDTRNNDLWFEATRKLIDSSRYREILFVKMLNQYPNFIHKEFSYRNNQDEEDSFKLKDIVNSFNNFKEKINYSFTTLEFPSDTLEVSEEERKVTLFFSYILYEIIREPINKELKKDLASLK